MRTMLVVVMALCLIAGTAIGKDLVKKEDLSRVVIDCSTAIPISCGDIITGDTTGLTSLFDEYGCGYSNETGGEIFYALTLDDCYEVTCTLSGMDADQDVFMGYCGDDLNCITYGDNSFTSGTLEAGDYYIVVDGYSGAAGNFTLEVTCALTDCPAEPLLNDVCTGAIDLNEQGLPVFDVDLTAGNGYTDTDNLAYGGCTGYGPRGPEAFYKIFLALGETFTATEDGECDMAMYLFTDCADIAASCLVGSDNCCSGAQELVTYVADAEGWYYLGVDTYSSAGCPVTVTIDAPIANESSNWGNVKSLYR